MGMKINERLLFMGASMIHDFAKGDAGKKKTYSKDYE